MEKKEKAFVIENNVLKGTGNLSPVLTHTSVGELMLDNLNSDPDFVGQLDAVTGEIYKFEKIRDRSVRCALWMKANGLLPEDVIVICTHNHLDVVIPLAAAMYLGAVVSPMDTGLRESDFEHMMKITKPKMAFVNEQIAETIARVAKDIKLDLRIVVFGQLPDFLGLESIIAEAGADKVKKFACTPIRDADQTAIIMCTSGTTGTPKGVALAHSVFLKQLKAQKISMFKNNYTLIFTPLAWYSGTYNVIMNLCTKATRLVPPAFEENLACELIEKHKVYLIFLAPNQLNRLLRSDSIKKCDLSSLKVVICGGACLAVESQKVFANMMPNAKLAMGYGMTEVGGAIAWQVPGSKLGSCGRIYETAQLKVIDQNTGETLGPNQQGELLIKTNTMLNGYYNDPQATAETIDEEGWIHSGDLGYFDEDGEVYVVDRIKELIKYRGYHISPVEIENLLLTHPGVSEVAVVSLPHPIDDEHPIAFVVKTDSLAYPEQLTEQELIDFVNAQVADHKKLRGGLKFLESLPKTPSSKIQRRDVRALAKSLATS